jgi:hypothetical protein
MVIEFRKPDEQVESKREWGLVTRDGKQIVAMVGRDLQAGIGRFGNTLVAALRDLADRIEAEQYPMPGFDF